MDVKVPRPKLMPDNEVLEIANGLLHRHGPEGLTFASLAEACGLSPATLVRRFENKTRLKQSVLLHAWDGLDERTAMLAAATDRTPEGAVRLLVALSQGYGGIEAYAEGLLLLREDLRDPSLRARGAAWKEKLTLVLDECFPDGPQGIGLLVAAQWQGSLLWWSFDPRLSVTAHVEASLRAFITALPSG